MRVSMLRDQTELYLLLPDQLVDSGGLGVEVVGDKPLLVQRRESNRHAAERFPVQFRLIRRAHGEADVRLLIKGFRSKYARNEPGIDLASTKPDDRYVTIGDKRGSGLVAYKTSTTEGASSRRIDDNVARS